MRTKRRDALPGRPNIDRRTKLPVPDMTYVKRRMDGNPMKKVSRFLALALSMALLVCLLASCGGKSGSVEAKHALSHDELVEKALAETGTFVVYGNTSRITTAAEDFAAL